MACTIQTHYRLLASATPNLPEPPGAPAITLTSTDIETIIYAQSSPPMVRTTQSFPHRPRQAIDAPKPTEPTCTVGLTCSAIQAIVRAKLGWPRPAGSPAEYAETAAVVGYSHGLNSHIHRSE